MRSIAVRWTLYFLIASIVNVIIVSVAAQQVTARTFIHYIISQSAPGFVRDAVDFYELCDSLEYFNPRLIGEFSSQELEERAEEICEGEFRLQPPPRLTNENGEIRSNVLRPTSFIVVDAETNRVLFARPNNEEQHEGESGIFEIFKSESEYHPDPGDIVSDRFIKNAYPIEVDVNGEIQTIAWAVATEDSTGFEADQIAFLRPIQHVIVGVSLVVIAISVFVGMWISRTMIRPLKELTAAVDDVADGDLHQVPVSHMNEIGVLAERFNRMSDRLQYSEDLRRQMLANIAHDLRNPLSIISGYSQAMMEGIMPLTEERSKIIYNEAHHLNQMIEDLRTLTLADAGQLTVRPQPTNPGEVVKQVADAFRVLSEQKQIRIEAETQFATGDLPVTIQADQDRIIQALSNLVSNAMRYTPENGSITVGAIKQKNGVTLFVRDTGRGIPPEKLPHIFDRFYRVEKLEEQHKGQSGLGLNIVKSIVDAHNGEISVESEVNKGTTFFIQFPPA